jgi:DNA-binding CsgD family transcriptional regulator
LRGDPVAVRNDVAPLADDERAGMPMRALAWQALLARALARGGAGGASEAEAEEAGELAATHLAWARSWGRPAALGIALRAAALAGPAGDGRIDLLGEAVETLSSSALRTEEGRARNDLGIALLRSGLRSEGRQQLEAALEIVAAVGDRPAAERISQELEIAGAAPKRYRFDEMTASERRVAELAAEGKTNREIAEELFVTPKTVENHLTRVYAKLGVSSRKALSGALSSAV